MTFPRIARATLVTTALVFVASLTGPALAERISSGHQVINGTRVFTQVYLDRGYATFSNDCGSQTLSQRELQGGAIPHNIIPCPRPGGARSSSGSSRSGGDLETFNAATDESYRVQGELEKAIDDCHRYRGFDHCTPASSRMDEVFREWSECTDAASRTVELRDNIECWKTETASKREILSLARQLQFSSSTSSATRHPLSEANEYLLRAKAAGQYCTYADQIEAGDLYRRAAKAFDAAGHHQPAHAARSAADAIFAPGGTADRCGLRIQQKSTPKVAASPAAGSPENTPASCAPAIEKMRALAKQGEDVDTLRVTLAAYGCRDNEDAAPMSQRACLKAKLQWRQDKASDAEIQQRLRTAGCRT